MGITTIGVPAVGIQAVSMSNQLQVPIFAFLIVKIVTRGQQLQVYQKQGCRYIFACLFVKIIMQGHKTQ